MDDIADSTTGKIWMRWSIGLLCFFLLLALDGFHSAWIAASGHGFHLKFMVAAPWGFALLGGANCIAAVRRNQMRYSVATVVLNMLSFMVMSSYQAMDGLSRLVR